MKKMSLSLTVVVGLVCILASSASADMIPIGFDSFSGMPNARPTLVPSASQLSDQLLSVSGVSFRSAADYVAVVNHEAWGTQSPPNVISGATADGWYTYDNTPISISFFDPSKPAVKAVTDYVSIRGDPAPAAGATATMEAFDVFGHSLGEVTAFDVPGGLTLSLTVPGIHSILLTQNASGTIGFDNLQFNSVVPVPLPGAVLLGAIGLSFAGWRLKRETT